MLVFNKNAYSEEFNKDDKNYQLKLQILNQKEQKLAKFDTAIADNEQKRAIGLMNLDNLAQNKAMLFVFNKEKIVSMWMKNTKIALDMIFIDENNIIVNIKHNATPYSLAIISSQKPIKKVLEINAGLSKKLGIKIGHKIKYENIHH